MRILVIRNSAMGDVALTLPPLLSFINAYPEHNVTLLTSSGFLKLFPENEKLDLFGADYKEKYNGPTGLLKLFIDLRVGVNPDLIIDLHGVIRSKVVTSLFRLVGVKGFTIEKGRSEKKSLITGEISEPLKHSIDRYLDVFRKAGFNFDITGEGWLHSEAPLPEAVSAELEGNKKIIGVAPYARHKLKMWPEDKMVLLLQSLNKEIGAKILFFGGGKDEIAKLGLIEKKVEGSFVVAGKLNMSQEISLLKRLDLMIAMDSSNMHFGALAGVPTVSIWGATHPMAGFGAWGQPPENAVQISKEELGCRPCTVYGKGECRRKDHACMTTLEPEVVLETIRKVLKGS